MTDDELKKLQKSKIVPGLRRVSRWWAPKLVALRKQKVGPNKYKCEGCGEIFTQKEVSLDHKAAVVNPRTGFVSWDDYIARMFCDSEGFQVLCSDVCHSTKSAIENELRKKYRIKKKKLTTKKK